MPDDSNLDARVTTLEKQVADLRDAVARAGHPVPDEMPAEAQFKANSPGEQPA